MSEESERVGSGPESNGAGVDPTALALALGGASREEADAFLKDERAILQKQGALIAAQLHHLHEQLKQIHLDVWEKRLGVLLRLATAFMGIAVAVVLGFMVWDAARDRGLIIEAFAVPPDLAARGLTGEVVAGRMLDKISDMDAHVNTVRAESSYISNWGKDLKVDIPETGISLDELERYLREKLGHPTHISGDIVRTATGISVTARAGAEAGKSFSGPLEDFDALMQQAAETVYASTQPYRYGIYLNQNGKVEEGLNFFESVVGTLSPSEQAWAYQGAYTALNELGRAPEAAEAARMGVALNRDFAFGWNHYGTIMLELGHDETALQAFRTAQRLLDQHIADDIEPNVVPRFHQEHAAQIDDLLGDYAAEIQEMQTNPSFIGAGKVGTTRIGRGQLALAMIVDHDLTAARRQIGGMPTRPGRPSPANFSMSLVLMHLSVASRDWRRVLQLGPTAEAQMAMNTSARSVGDFYSPTDIWPNIAYAQAMMGHFAAAHAEIDKTPGDCDACMRIRGRIDAAQGNYAGAAFWFARAATMAPSIPFADTDWGQVLLTKGDANGAIAKFALANKIGPHFADPLEGWGEALMARNQSHLALAKFAEAEKYAPNWGRLHLKWGEALYYAGKKDDAQKQFARAAQLDLVPEEKTELARIVSNEETQH